MQFLRSVRTSTVVFAIGVTLDTTLSPDTLTPDPLAANSSLQAVLSAFVKVAVGLSDKSGKLYENDGLAAL